jgi:hypothetical protein
MLFSTPTGKLFWERNFYRDVWYPAIRASGIDCGPHEFGHYTHALGRGFDRVRELIG